MVLSEGSGTPRDRVVKLLGGVEGGGSFSVKATMSPDDLDVEVRDVGGLRFPMTERQSQRLIGVARPALYGLGEDTLLDPRVRDTWEVPKSRVKIDNRRWNKALTPVLDGFRRELGLPEECRLKAQLHSMLVYGPGQHFAPHQDSEKADAMVASLVVTLPGSFTGGSLVVGHGTDRATYRGSRDRLSLVAFYADCRHEIRPVRTGHRVVLTYNLMLMGEASNPDVRDDAVAELATCLDRHFTTPVPAPAWRRDGEVGDPPDRLVYLLDHDYTAHGLDWSLLKGADSAQVAALRATADVSDCEVVLALADIHETWNAFEAGGNDRWGWRSRQGWWDDDDDETSSSDDVDDYVLDDLIESEVSLVHWIDTAGEAGEAISTSVDDSEVCAATPSHQLAPYESAYEPYMGNYGNTMDRWYRRGAVVLWPRRRAFAVRAEASPSWALDQIQARIASGALAEAHGLIADLAPLWQRIRTPGHDLFVAAMRVALGIEDGDLARTLLAPFAIEQLVATDGPALAGLCDRYGAAWMNDLIGGWSNQRGAGRDWLTWVPCLPDVVDGLGPEAAGQATARPLVAEAVRRLRADVGRPAHVAPPSRRATALDELTVPVLAVAKSVATIGADDLRDQVLEILSVADNDRTIGDFLLGVLRGAGDLDEPTRQAAGFHAIARQCIERIGSRLAQPPRNDDDWSIEFPGGCECQLCETLGTFLADPAERTHEWPIAEAKRQHVHARIDAAELPVDHRTRRQGRPYTLVLTKKADLFERDAQARRSDESNLSWLQASW